MVRQELSKEAGLVLSEFGDNQGEVLCTSSKTARTRDLGVPL